MLSQVANPGCFIADCIAIVLSDCVAYSVWPVSLQYKVLLICCAKKTSDLKVYSVTRGCVSSGSSVAVDGVLHWLSITITVHIVIHTRSAVGFEYDHVTVNVSTT